MDDGRSGFLISGWSLAQAWHFFAISSIWVLRLGHQTHDCARVQHFVICRWPSYRCLNISRCMFFGMTRCLLKSSRSSTVVKYCLLDQYCFSKGFWDMKAGHPSIQYLRIISVYSASCWACLIRSMVCLAKVATASTALQSEGMGADAGAWERASAVIWCFLGTWMTHDPRGVVWSAEHVVAFCGVLLLTAEQRGACGPSLWWNSDDGHIYLVFYKLMLPPVLPSQWLCIFVLRPWGNGKCSRRGDAFCHSGPEGGLLQCWP